jgi:hypothetical protein
MLDIIWNYHSDEGCSQAANIIKMMVHFTNFEKSAEEVLKSIRELLLGDWADICNRFDSKSNEGDNVDGSRSSPPKNDEASEESCGETATIPCAADSEDTYSCATGALSEVLDGIKATFGLTGDKKDMKGKTDKTDKKDKTAEMNRDIAIMVEDGCKDTGHDDFVLALVDPSAPQSARAQHFAHGNNLTHPVAKDDKLKVLINAATPLYKLSQPADPGAS